MTEDIAFTNDDSSALEKGLAAAGLTGRRNIIKSLLPNSSTTIGLEIAPNFAPLITKTERNILYCDYLTYDELVEREKNNQPRIDCGLTVQKLDFIWKSGKELKECSPINHYDFIISSHVLEHVPDFLGYLYQMRSVLKDDGVIAFVLPDIKGSGEYFRRTSTCAELINAYLNASNWPTAAQIYDGFRHHFRFENQPVDGKTLVDFSQDFTAQDCYTLAQRSLTDYIDVHCWSFSIDSFLEVMKELKSIGAFDFDIDHCSSSEPTITGSGAEFFVKLRPTKPAREIIKPTFINSKLLDNSSAHEVIFENNQLDSTNEKLIHLQNAYIDAIEKLERIKREKINIETHAKKAFEEAVVAQEQLKKEKFAAEQELTLLKTRSIRTILRKYIKKLFQPYTMQKI